MARILITGVSGTGKSTTIDALRERGYIAADADYDGFSALAPALPGDLTGPGDGLDWMLDLERARAFFAEAATPHRFLSVCSPNQGELYTLVDRVVLLTAPLPLISERLQTRTNNPFGSTEDERLRALQIAAQIEPLLRGGATDVIDTSASLRSVVDQLIQIADDSG